MTLARIALAVLLGLALALLESRALWGYWFARPSLCRELTPAEHVVGFSMLTFSPNGEWLIVSDRRTAAEDAERFCQPDSNECREGRLIACLRQRAVTLESVSELRPERYAVLLTPSLVQEWEPEPSDPRYQHSSRPARGVAIHFMRAGKDWLLVGYRTSEFANDRYAYGEVLLQITDQGATVARRVRFQLDIAGLEGLEWPVLWPVNAAIVLLVTWLGARSRYFQRTRPMKKDHDQER